MPTATLIVSIAVAALGGGAINALLVHRRETRSGDRAWFERKYELLEQQNATQRGRIDHLEAVVVALSDSLVELGVDPLKIRNRISLCEGRPYRKDHPR